MLYKASGRRLKESMNMKLRFLLKSKEESMKASTREYLHIEMELLLWQQKVLNFI